MLVVECAKFFPNRPDYKVLTDLVHVCCKRSNPLPPVNDGLLCGLGKSIISQQTRDVDPMLFKGWSIVCDAGQTLKQHCLNVSCWLGLTTSIHVRHYLSNRHHLPGCAFSQYNTLLFSTIRQHSQAPHGIYILNTSHWIIKDIFNHNKEVLSFNLKY